MPPKKLSDKDFNDAIGNINLNELVSDIYHNTPSADVVGLKYQQETEDRLKKKSSRQSLKQT